MEISPTGGLVGAQRSFPAEPSQPAFFSGGFTGKAGAGSVFGRRSPRCGAGEARRAVPDQRQLLQPAAGTAVRSFAYHLVYIMSKGHCQDRKPFI